MSVTPSQPSVFVALGSNLGNSKAIIAGAFAELEQLSACPLVRSSLWQTEPVDCPPGSPPFINAVAGLCPRPQETAESLLSKLQELEQRFGRTPKKVMNESRPLDLDIIAFESEMRRSLTLVLPHPRAATRSFVLEPLAEIAPDLVLPGQSAPVRELLGRLPVEYAPPRRLV